MIDPKALLTDLQSLLKRLEADLLDRSESDEVPDVGRTLHAEFERAKQAERTVANYEDWRNDAITQAAAAWVLSCVFVRFLEDNLLTSSPRIAGPKERLQMARDEHEIYFRQHPRETDRDYLLAVFDELAELPGAKDVFGDHNPIRELPTWLSGDAACELLRFFQKINANTGDLIHDFTDQQWDTRFLGDLYQELSEAARKKFALLQTPEFVEEFILDRTLDPALDEFDLVTPAVTDSQGKPITERGFRMIDAACGSGHFLIGAFPRILKRWHKQEPSAKICNLVQNTLNCIHGVDVNPYAIAIARFRLLLAALRACGIQQLREAPAFQFNLVCGDSLLHAPLRSGQRVLDWELTTDDSECEHAYQSENLLTLKRILRSGIYHAVVSNPPYIVPRDQQLKVRYRRRYSACYDQYSLAAPFMQRLFSLGVDSAFIGQITTASFCKREYGKKLVQEWLPKIDLTTVVDSSGAYIPGHNNAGEGTTTIILFGRNQRPLSRTVRVAMGLRAEPGVPENPAQGKVWLSILRQLDDPKSKSEFITVCDVPRERFTKHPWAIGGGGAAELKEQLDSSCELKLGNISSAIGRGAHTGEDDVYVATKKTLLRRRLPSSQIVPFVAGDAVRDWLVDSSQAIAFPYSRDLTVLTEPAAQWLLRVLWSYRNQLWNRVEGAGTHRTIGLTWYEFSRFHPERFVGRCITYGEIASHNHFSVDSGYKIYNRTAPVIKLRGRIDEADLHGIVGILNSSTALFWGRQTLFPKGGFSGGKWEERLVWNSKNLTHFPLPIERPLQITLSVLNGAKALTALLPHTLLSNAEMIPTREESAELAKQWDVARKFLFYGQEELDWKCYQLYGLIDQDLTYKHEEVLIELGERAFEIVMARKILDSQLETTWFARHGAILVTEIPEHWPEDYRRVVQRRIEVLETNSDINLIERPEYKRRWVSTSWSVQFENALQAWLLDRLESYFDFDGRMNDEGKTTARLDISLTTVARIADVANQDGIFMEVGELYREDPAFDVQRLVAELVQAESVPLLPVLRYKPSGLRKRAEWEKTWDLQRREDAIDARTTLPHNDPQYLTEDQARDLKRHEIGDIPVPPKYTSADFLSSGGARYWALRGKLDVPKERWISFPHCEGPDGTLVIAWAGYDHLQLARAISAYYVEIQEHLGGRDDPRLVPLLACVIELLPWLRQWHNDIDPDFDQRMDEFFEGFVAEEAKALNMTIDEVKRWQPPTRTGGRRQKGGKA